VTQVPSQPAESVLGLRDQVAVLWLRKWWVLAAAAIAVGTALVLSLSQTPQYRSDTKVLVQSVTLFPGNAAGVPKINMETEQQLAKSPAVAELAAADLASTNPTELLNHVTVKAETDTEILVIGFSDPKPRRAQEGAQAFAAAYIEFRRSTALNDLNAAKQPLDLSIQSLRADLRRVTEQLRRTQDPNEVQALEFQSDTLVRQIADLQTQVNQLVPADRLRVGQVVAPPQLPGSPVSPNIVLNVLLALLLGLAVGVGIAFLRERLDERLRGMGDLEAHVGAPVLAAVPRSVTLRNPYQGVIASQADRDPAAVEAYRTLRAGMLIAAARASAKVILITSPHPGEGKTTTTANLAATLAHSGKRVVAVSADYRRPRLHRFFAIADAPGLTEVLTGSVNLREALVPSVIPNLSIIPSGRSPSNRDGLLGTEAVVRLIEELRKIADFVLIDVAPVLGVADAVTLAPAVDGVLFVVDAERTTRRAVERTRRELFQVNASILGAVFNKHRAARERAYPYYAPLPQTAFTPRPSLAETNGPESPRGGLRRRPAEADRSTVDEGDGAG
jgi:capsular exopolysaccharide synthesis family protein